MGAGPGRPHPESGLDPLARAKRCKTLAASRAQVIRNGATPSHHRDLLPPKKVEPPPVRVRALSVSLRLPL